MLSRHLSLRKICLFGNNYPLVPKITTREFTKSNSKLLRGQTSRGNSNPLHPFESAGDYVPGSGRPLLKPLGFTVAFSTASFAGAAIWQYENLRCKALRMAKEPYGWFEGFGDRVYGYMKQGSWRREINSWWNSLTEGQRLFYPICFANCLVFLAWRVPRFQPTMVKYFCSNPFSRSLCWPMFFSTFSHYSALHLAANMFVLHSFSSGAVGTLGKEQFLGLYLSAGVIASFASYLHKVAFVGGSGMSLGASGAIMAILGYVCTQYPDTKLAIIFLPMLTFSAGSAIKVILAIDAAGVLMGWRFFDHAAHLGGALYGICWATWGEKYLWPKREPLIRWWHDIRKTS